MQTLDSREEQNLLSAIKQAVDLVNGGMAPDSAITKIAKDERYTPGKIKLVCAAYNTGKQTAQREDNKNILDKFAEFPLADADAVISRIYGKAEKKAEDVHADYAKAPSNWYKEKEREKLAHMRLPEIQKTAAPVPTFETVMGHVTKLKFAAEEQRRDLSSKADAVNSKFASLVSYFRTPADHREAFGVVEKIASSFFNPADVKSLMDSVYNHLGLQEKFVGTFKVSGEKRAAAITIKPQTAPIDINAAPYSLIRDNIKAAHAMHEAQEMYLKIAQCAQSLEADVISAYVNKEAGGINAVDDDKDEDDGIFKKKAFNGVIPTQGLFAYNQLRTAMTPFGSPAEDQTIDMVKDLDSADHLTDMRKIKTQAMLNRFMTDAEDPISGYDPDRVVSAFNEIAAMAPRSAEQPGIMGPLLRRRLAGRVEPFESGEITGTETKLKELGGGGSTLAKRPSRPPEKERS